MALLNLSILLISSQQLGRDIVGQVSLLILNIAVVQIINEIYTGYALVHYIPKFSVNKLYKTGLVWIILSTALVNLLFLVVKRQWPHLNIGLQDLWIHGLILSFIITLHSFHCVILLGKEKIMPYNFLMVFQPLALVAALCVNVFVLGNKTVSSYIIALYCSYCGSVLLSAWQLLRVLNTKKDSLDLFSTRSVIKNGLVNQLGNLAHTLSNRYNYYMIGSTALVGIYASATSLVESVWIIGSSVAPIILTRVANQSDTSNISQVTFLLSKLSFILSCGCVCIIILLPDHFFTFLLGKDFTHTKTIMLHLAPGVLCISLSTVISHYFSGLGHQKVQLIANSAGLLTTVCTSYYLISRYQLIGACYAASLSYFVASLILVVVFMKQNKFRFRALFSIRHDFFLLRK